MKPLFTEPANRQASGAFELLSAQGQNGENHDHWSAQRAAAEGGWRSILYISHKGELRIVVTKDIIIKQLPPLNFQGFLLAQSAWAGRSDARLQAMDSGIGEGQPIGFP